jgi:N-carbamoyl-L-amino-acid hydrolase
MSLSERVAAAVDGARQWQRLMDMAKLGAIAGDGVDRACLTPLDRDARRIVMRWAEEAGATCSVDAAGNLWLRREGTDPAAAPVLSGSHMDTQPQGGRFDGIYGVLAALEVLSALHDCGVTTRRSMEVVAWTNEEGSRFGPGCMGSMAWSGHSELETFSDSTDAQGLRFGDALAELLASEADVPRRALGGTTPHAYIEAHIEQGPLLEREGLAIGAVTGIQGSRWFVVTLTGDSAHAGTTPLRLRRDAMQAFVRVATALNTIMYDPDDVLRFTIGRLQVEPNSSNSVAGRVVFTIDLRHPDAAVLRARGDAILGVIEAAAGDVAIDLRETFDAPPSVFDPDLVSMIEQAATALQVGCRRMPSGAFHDAQFVNRVCPSAMIFVPSHKGISHNPAEYSSPEQLESGTRVLAWTLMELAS